MYAVCLLAVTMCGIAIIIVYKSPIRNVLLVYSKWLEVIKFLNYFFQTLSITPA